MLNCWAVEANTWTSLLLNLNYRVSFDLSWKQMQFWKSDEPWKASNSHLCMYSFIRFKFSSVIVVVSFSEFLVRFLRRERFLGVSLLFFHSGIWWIIAAILSWFKSWVNLISADRSNGCCSFSPISHKKTRSWRFFHTFNILIIHASWYINCDAVSKGSLLVGSKTLMGHKSIYLIWFDLKEIARNK